MKADRMIRWGVVVLLALVPTSNLWGQPGNENNPLSWDRNIRGLFSRYCYRCHNDDESSGGIDLSADVDPRKILQRRDVWESVAFVLSDGSMPPGKARQPSTEEREQMRAFLDLTLAEIDCASANDPGPPPLRRLNRVEYDHAIYDLTGLDLRLAAETFPPDTTSYGFDNIGLALTMTPVQVEQYHTAARTIVEKWIATQSTAPTGYQRIFGHGEPNDEAELRSRLKSFSDAAFRRPADDAWVNRLVGLYQQSRQSGEDHPTAMGHAVTAILIAPQFLIRIERNQIDRDDPYPVDDYELASRLSFFLWSRPPDDTLISLAQQRLLHDPEVLRQQMLRMLRDPRSGALVDNFFGQWLGLREVAGHSVDADQFPEFNEPLRDAMLAEVRALLTDLIVADRSIGDLLDANYAFLNAPLAKHYGLPSDGLSETRLQRVALTDRRRGGVLTSAALLMVQSDPNRTNIPRRGNYLAERILGDPPPPPPPDVPELEVVGDGQAVPLRELFERHSASPACASCHARIDPFGFALENYDAIGRWRDQDAGQPIDASGKLPSGDALDGPVSLKQFLVESPEVFTRTMSKNLLIYALGRGLTDSDRCVLDAIVETSDGQLPAFSDVVWTIISSRPFLLRRNPEF